MIESRLAAIGLVLTATAVAAVASFFLKRGAGESSFAPGNLRVSKWVIAGAGCYVLSTALFFIGLTGGPLSLLYPFTATQYIWVTLIARYLLGERINMWKVAGVGLIVAGVTFVGLGI